MGNNLIIRGISPSDPRLTDARTPVAHAASHATAGDDALAAGDIGAATSGHAHSGTYEPVLGTPGTDGHILSSTIAGVRSWIAAVSLSVANTWTALQTFSAGIVAGWVAPAADGVASFKILKADKTTQVVTVDTTNGRVGIGDAPGSAGFLVSTTSAAAFWLKADSAAATQILLSGKTNENQRLYIGYDTTNDIGYIKCIKEGVSLKTLALQSAANNLARVAIGQSSATARLDVVGGDEYASGFRLRTGVAPTNPNDGDIWYDGTNLKMRVGGTTAGLLTRPFGQIYAHDGSDTQNPGVTYALITQWLSNGPSSTGVTPDQANNKISIAATALGIYRVTLNLSYSGTGGSDWVCAVFFDGVECDQVEFQRKLGVGGDVGSGGATGFVDVTGAGDFDVRVRSDGASDDFVLVAGSLCVDWVGPT